MREVSALDERKFPKLPSRVIVKLEAVKRPPTTQSKFVSNPELGGVCVDMEYPFKLDEHVDLRFSVPIMGHEAEVFALATVVWASETQVGLRFDQLKSRPAEAMAEYLRIQGLASQAAAASEEADSSPPKP